MDIPRRKNRQHSDKLTAELLFFCLWLTRCGEVELGCFESYGLENYGQHSPSSYRRYAKELEKCGAIPRMKLRGNNTDGNNRRRFISAPPVEEFVPLVRFDLADDHLRRLARLVCMARRCLRPMENCRHLTMPLRTTGTTTCTIPTITQRMRDWTPARSGVTGSWRVMSY